MGDVKLSAAQMSAYGGVSDGLFSWSVLLGTLYLSTIDGSTWIITLQLCKQKTLNLNLP
jgi:hypothetical protein